MSEWSFEKDSDDLRRFFWNKKVESHHLVVVCFDRLLFSVGQWCFVIVLDGLVMNQVFYPGHPVCWWDGPMIAWHVRQLAQLARLLQVNVRMDPDDEELRWILAGAALVMTDD